MAVTASWCTGRKPTLVIAMLFLARHAFTAVRSSITTYGRLLPVFLLWVWAAKVKGVEVSCGGLENTPRCPLAIDGPCSFLVSFLSICGWSTATSGSHDFITFPVHVRCTWTVESIHGEVRPPGGTPMSVQFIGAACLDVVLKSFKVLGHHLA